MADRAWLRSRRRVVGAAFGGLGLAASGVAIVLLGAAWGMVLVAALAVAALALLALTHVAMGSPELGPQPAADAREPQTHGPNYPEARLAWAAEAQALSDDLRGFSDLIGTRLGGSAGAYTRATGSSRRMRADLRQRATRTTDWPIKAAGRAAAVPSEDLLALDESVLTEQRDRYRAGEPGPVVVVSDLVARAELSLGGPLYSVIDKTTLPPSGDRHDYWTVAPYWWPDPESSDGLPYIRRDGDRLPGTTMWEPGSERYDRSSLQSMIDETTVAALAGYFTGQERFLARGADLLRCWFLDTKTRMNPHLGYAQVRRGHDRDQGSASGLIDVNDFYYLLDAARLLDREEALTPSESDALRDWFTEYRRWLRQSPQGRAARGSVNNRGTWYEVQVAAIDAYLYDAPGLLETIHRVQSRLPQQFAPDGSQPEELARTLSLHYCAYNLQGWLVLAAFARRAGQDLWSIRTPQGAGLRVAVTWLLNYLGTPWPHEQVTEFDRDRLVVLAHEAAGSGYGPELVDLLGPDERDPWRVRQVFTGSEGIRPYWLLGATR
jgi:hypothetical protein